MHAQSVPQDVAKLLSELEKLCVEAERILSSPSMKIDDVQQMAVYASEIRYALSRLPYLPACSEHAGIPQKLARSFAERFLELEGRIKELRNDLLTSRS